MCIIINSIQYLSTSRVHDNEFRGFTPSNNFLKFAGYKPVKCQRFEYANCVSIILEMFAVRFRVFSKGIVSGTAVQVFFTSTLFYFPALDIADQRNYSFKMSGIYLPGECEFPGAVRTSRSPVLPASFWRDLKRTGSLERLLPSFFRVGFPFVLGY